VRSGKLPRDHKHLQEQFSQEESEAKLSERFRERIAPDGGALQQGRIDGLRQGKLAERGGQRRVSMGARHADAKSRGHLAATWGIEWRGGNQERKMATPAEKGAAFRALHERPGAFIIPNPWDLGTARLLEAMGFEALATTSGGFAFSQGKPDGAVDRDTMLAHATAMAAATDIPVSADLENGYADDPDGVAETVRRATRAGLAGCSIEDVGSRSRNPGRAPYEIKLAAERARAAAEAAHAAGFPFLLTARAENFIIGRPDLRDTIARLQAFQEAGADVLFAPGLTSREEIRTVVGSVDRPVNVIMGLQGVRLSAAELAELGVKRVSVGSSLARKALTAFLQAAREMKERGTFRYADDAMKYAEITAKFA
jgi:2-methylisocitrate lyase-like PEP mutase family enzyme